MAGSPRIERPARIRLENPKLSTEEATKLAGYTDEEAKDQKRQSNVRQMTHRLSKGRKRPADIDFHNPDSKRMSYPPAMHDTLYHNRRSAPLHLPDQSMMHDYPRMPIDMQFSQQQQHQQQQQQQSRLPIDSSMPLSQHQQQIRYPGDNMSTMSHLHHPQPQQQHQQLQLPQQHQQLQQQQHHHTPQQIQQQQQLLQPVPYNTPDSGSVLTVQNITESDSCHTNTHESKSRAGHPLTWDNTSVYNE